MINSVSGNLGPYSSTAQNGPFGTASAPAPAAAQGSASGATGQSPVTGAAGVPAVPGAAAAGGLAAAGGREAALAGAQGAQNAPAVSGQAPGTASSGVGGTSSTAATTGSSQDVTGTDTFLKLLVAQLKNQDPMSPMNDQSFVTELAQFNTVEQMLGVKQSINNELSAQQSTEGVAMLGKTITYSVPGIGSNAATTSQGVVSGVSMAGGQVQLQIGTTNVPLSEVSAVSS